jgi:hypothetical protein
MCFMVVFLFYINSGQVEKNDGIAEKNSSRARAYNFISYAPI